MPFNPEVLGFHESYPVAGKSTITDIYPKGHRCGIYLLEFSNGEFYCGQAKDVTRRYVQHKKNHPDISAIRFFEVEPEELTNVEQNCIHRLEAENYLLRNIIFVSVVSGERDFNQIMSVKNQQRWLSDQDYVDLEGERFQDENLRRRYHHRFQRLMKLPYFEPIVNVMKKYAQNCLPAIRRSEYQFWSCSCLPYSGFNLYSRINIYQQEVFAAFIDANLKIPVFTFQLTQSIIEEGGRLQQIRRRLQIGSLVIVKHRYTPGGKDQFRMEIKGFDDFEKFLADPVIKQSIRTFNLRLMRKGPCLNKANHCLDLADRLLE